MMPNQPRWKTALVTGASSGIGEALSRQLAAQGVHVLMVARRLGNLKKIQQDIQRQGGKATAIQLDIQKYDTAVKKFEALDSRHGGIDLVIANAGIGINLQPSYTWQSVRSVLEINYLGAIATITSLIPAMGLRGGGNIVAISSLAGYGPLPDAAGYSSPKAGLSRFMECLALDLQGSGVYTSTVHVGFVATAMVAKSTFPLPFLISSDAAAEYILRRVSKNKRLINFPKPMVILVALLSLLPFGIKKWLARIYWRGEKTKFN
jgi:short-subunit dehydrogenase